MYIRYNTQLSLRDSYLKILHLRDILLRNIAISPRNLGNLLIGLLLLVGVGGQVVEQEAGSETFKFLSKSRVLSMSCPGF